MNREVLDKITYLAGSIDVIEKMSEITAKVPFSGEVKALLSEVSKILMKDARSRQYSDVVSFAFWIRGTSVTQLEDKYSFRDENCHLGRGVAFHIAPSNVPVNFAYSLVSGLLTGNANIVRVPSKDFPQVEIITDAFNMALNECESMKPYIALVKYGRSQEINNELSSISDTRIIWGGDQTIAELRKSPLPPRSTEITFADRYSIAIIDADSYLAIENKNRVAQDFYNDTFFSDQNACTSPRVVVWTTSSSLEILNTAKEQFWSKLHTLVEEKYIFQDIMGVNKLTSVYLAAADKNIGNIRVEENADNRIFRVRVNTLTNRLLDYYDNSGYFYEYDCRDIMDLIPLVNNKRCQTIGYIGDKNKLIRLVASGIKGIDRIVSIGHTMDFDLVWDGYDLVRHLTREIVI